MGATSKTVIHCMLKSDACYYDFLLTFWTVISTVFVVIPSIVGLVSLAGDTEAAEIIRPLLSGDFVIYVVFMRLFFSYHVVSKSVHFIFSCQKSGVPIKSLGLICVCVSCVSVLFLDMKLHFALTISFFILVNMGLTIAFSLVRDYIQPIHDMSNENLCELEAICSTTIYIELLWILSFFHVIFNVIALVQGSYISDTTVKISYSIPGLYFGFYSCVVCRLLHHFCYQISNPNFLCVRKYH